MSEALSRTQRRPRIAALDLARALALVAMFAYHFIWDLRFFDLISVDLATSQPFRIFSHSIASTFLFVSGISLVLAHRRAIRWPAYWKHVGMIAGAAMLVTLGTYIVVPQGLVTFGILHCIAAALLVALPFLFLPAPAALAGGLAAIALPLMFRSGSFDIAALNWIGLGFTEPPTFDWRPLLPWTGVTLLGVFTGRLFAGSALEDRIAQWRGAGSAWRPILWGGRNSLLVYLVHQPVLMGLLLAYVMATGGFEPRQEANIAAACARDCVAAGTTSQQVCERRCACTIAALKTSRIWDKVKANDLDAPARQMLNASIQMCARENP